MIQRGFVFPAFNNPKLSKIDLKTKFRLLFVPKIIGIDYANDDHLSIVHAKVLDGVTYITKIEHLPGRDKR